MELRLCRVNGVFGYFHCWEQFSDVVAPSPMVGGHPGGTVSQIFGLVEFHGEPVKRVQPKDIVFCDEDNSKLHYYNDFIKREESNDD